MHKQLCHCSIKITHYEHQFIITLYEYMQTKKTRTNPSVSEKQKYNSAIVCSKIKVLQVFIVEDALPSHKMPLIQGSNSALFLLWMREQYLWLHTHYNQSQHVLNSPNFPRRKICFSIISTNYCDPCRTPLNSYYLTQSLSCLRAVKFVIVKTAGEFSLPFNNILILVD